MIKIDNQGRHLGEGLGRSVDPKDCEVSKILHYPQAQIAVCTVVIMILALVSS